MSIFIVQKQKYRLGKKRNGFLDISGTRLAQGLNIRVFTPKIKPTHYKTDDIIINWGLTDIPWLSLINKPYRLINSLEAVKNSSNKLKSFDLFKENGDIPHPTVFINKEEVELHLDSNPNDIIFCRTLLSSSSGKGITVARNKEEIVDAPLYTLYIRKKWEYRVHIAFDKVIHIQQKRKLTTEQLEERGIIERNSLIRNLDNGYIYSNNLDANETILSKLNTVSLDAITSIGLNFGAVDLIVKENGLVYVLEVNSAPGIEGTTLSKYVEAFQQAFNLPIISEIGVEYNV